MTATTMTAIPATTSISPTTLPWPAWCLSIPCPRPARITTRICVPGEPDEYQVGFLPYSIVDGWQQLQKDFAYWRADVAAERSVTSKADRAWFARDRRLREMIVLRDLGYWSHFVGDASQPMHVSIHRDGWGDYPNPEGYSATKGFHGAFEGRSSRATFGRKTSPAGCGQAATANAQSRLLPWPICAKPIPSFCRCSNCKRGAFSANPWRDAISPPSALRQRYRNCVT